MTRDVLWRVSARWSDDAARRAVGTDEGALWCEGD
jgi:hypothetical protein